MRLFSKRLLPRLRGKALGLVTQWERLGISLNYLETSRERPSPKWRFVAPRWARAIVVETSESKLEEQPELQPVLPVPWVTPTKKKTRAYVYKAFKALFVSTVSTASPVEVDRKKQKASSKWSFFFLVAISLHLGIWTNNYIFSCN